MSAIKLERMVQFSMSGKGSFTWRDGSGQPAAIIRILTRGLA